MAPAPPSLRKPGALDGVHFWFSETSAPPRSRMYYLHGACTTLVMTARGIFLVLWDIWPTLDLGCITFMAPAPPSLCTPGGNFWFSETSAPPSISDVLPSWRQLHPRYESQGHSCSPLRSFQTLPRTGSWTSHICT